MKRNILLLFILLIHPLFTADSYIRKIESISYRSQNGNTIALIKLTDDSVWKWMPDSYSEHLLRTWEDGDEIVIKVINHPGFLLQNLAKPLYTPIVALTFNSYSLFPTIKTVDLENNLIVLSDGSNWQLQYDFNKRTLHYWRVGQRIIPVRGVHDTLELISLDIPHGNPCQIERSIPIGSAILSDKQPSLALEQTIFPREGAYLQEDHSKLLESFEKI